MSYESTQGERGTYSTIRQRRGSNMDHKAIAQRFAEADLRIEQILYLAGENPLATSDAFERFVEDHSGKEVLPSLLDVVTASINIMQVRITRSRMAGEPPELIIAPRLGHLGLLDFHRAEEAIEEGRRAVSVSLHSLDLLGLPNG